MSCRSRKGGCGTFRRSEDLEAFGYRGRLGTYERPIRGGSTWRPSSDRDPWGAALVGRLLPLQESAHRSELSLATREIRQVPGVGLGGPPHLETIPPIFPDYLVAGLGRGRSVQVPVDNSPWGFQSSPAPLPQRARNRLDGGVPKRSWGGVVKSARLRGRPRRVSKHPMHMTNRPSLNFVPRTIHSTTPSSDRPSPIARRGRRNPRGPPSPLRTATTQEFRNPRSPAGSDLNTDRTRCTPLCRSRARGRDHMARG